MDAITKLRMRSLVATTKAEHDTAIKDYALERLQELKDRELNCTDPILRDAFAKQRGE